MKKPPPLASTHLTRRGTLEGKWKHVERQATVHSKNEKHVLRSTSVYPPTTSSSVHTCKQRFFHSFFFFFLPISSGQHYLPFNHSNSSNQSLPCAVVHQGCNFCNCLRYQLICCDFLIEVVRWKDFHHFNRTCWTTFWFGPVTSQNLHWFPRQLFWTMTLCDVPSSPVKNNKLLFLFSIFLSRLNKEACCVS